MIELWKTSKGHPELRAGARARRAVARATSSARTASSAAATRTATAEHQQHRPGGLGARPHRDGAARPGPLPTWVAGLQLGAQTRRLAAGRAARRDRLRQGGAQGGAAGRHHRRDPRPVAPSHVAGRAGAARSGTAAECRCCDTSYASPPRPWWPRRRGSACPPPAAGRDLQHRLAASRWSSTSTSSAAASRAACDADGAGKYAAAQFTDVGHTLTYVQRQPGVRLPGRRGAVERPVRATPRRPTRTGRCGGPTGSPARGPTRRPGVGSLKVPDGGYVALSWQKRHGKAPPRVTPTPARARRRRRPDADLASRRRRRPSRPTRRPADQGSHLAADGVLTDATSSGAPRLASHPPSSTLPRHHRAARRPTAADHVGADGAGRGGRTDAAEPPDTSGAELGLGPARLGGARVWSRRCSSPRPPSPSYAGNAPAAPDACPPRGRPPAAGPAPRGLVAVGGRPGRRRRRSPPTRGCSCSLIGVACLAVAARRSALPWADSFRLYLWLGLVDRGDPGVLPDPRGRRRRRPRAARPADRSRCRTGRSGSGCSARSPRSRCSSACTTGSGSPPS